MRDIWFGDKRDLVKWSVLLRLAERYQADHILQLAYYRPSTFGTVTIDGEEGISIPQEVIDLFRNILNIKKLASNTKVKVFDRLFDNRNDYLREAIAFIRRHDRKKQRIIFLDPDTGLQPLNNHTRLHVRNIEVRQIFEALTSKDVFVFYQHKPLFNGQGWIERMRTRLADAVGLPVDNVKVACGLDIARDVVFYFIEKA